MGNCLLTNKVAKSLDSNKSKESDLNIQEQILLRQKAEKMFSNKFAFTLVLIGLISVMLSSAMMDDKSNTTTPVASNTTTPVASNTTTPAPSNQTTTDGTTNGSGYPSINYGMLFSVCGALFYLIF